MLATLNEDDRDALQELCNLAIGAGGEALADFSGQFVTLSIPKFAADGHATLAEAALAGLGDVTQISAVSQPFSLASQEGLALCVSCSDSLDVLAQSEHISSAAKGIRLQEQISQSVIYAALKRLAEVAEIDLGLGDLQPLCHQQPKHLLTAPAAAQWSDFLAVEMNYRLENHVFNTSLALLIPPPVLEQLLEAVQRLMA